MKKHRWWHRTLWVPLEDIDRYSTRGYERCLHGGCSWRTEEFVSATESELDFR